MIKNFFVLVIVGLALLNSTLTSGQNWDKPIHGSFVQDLLDSGDLIDAPVLRDSLFSDYWTPGTGITYHMPELAEAADDWIEQVSADSFVIHGSICVSANDSLIIDPGMTIIFDDTTGTFQFYVEGFDLTGIGGLLASGTADEPILFTSFNKRKGDYLGLNFGRLYFFSGLSTLRHCYIEYGSTAISTRFVDIDMNNCVLQKLFSGIHVWNSSVFTDSCMIMDNRSGVHIVQGQYIAEHTSIINNVLNGITFNGNWGGHIELGDLENPNTYSQGFNSFYGNGRSSGNHYDVHGSLGILTKAENNWWGTNNPDEIAMNISGLVDFEPFLIEDPVNIETPSIIQSEMLSNLINYPNPFSEATTLFYQLPAATDVNLSLYDVSGRLIETIISQPQAAGDYRLTWDRPMAGGLYFIRLQTPYSQQTKRMVCIR